jgi:hypothetical protein
MLFLSRSDLLELEFSPFMLDVHEVVDSLAELSKYVLSYPIFIPKLSTHRMHDPGSNVPYIQPKVLTDNQMS